MKIFNLTPLLLISAIVVGLVFSGVIISIVASSSNYIQQDVVPKPTVVYQYTQWNATIPTPPIADAFAILLNFTLLGILILAISFIIMVLPHDSWGHRRQ